MFPGITLDPTLIGIFIQTVVLGITFTVFLQGLKAQLSLIKNDVRYLQEAHRSLAEAFTQLGRVLTAVAVQDNRINMLEKRIDELSHGKGLVK